MGKQVGNTTETHNAMTHDAHHEPKPRGWRALGKTQRAVLIALRRYGVYGPGARWTWDNDSNTRRILDSLVRRGLVLYDADSDRYFPVAEPRAFVSFKTRKEAEQAIDAANLDGSPDYTELFSAWRIILSDGRLYTG